MAIFLDIDPDALKADFTTRTILFRHRLHETGLFDLETLADVAVGLHAKNGERDVYATSVGTRVDESFVANRYGDVSVADSILNVRTNKTWNVLKRVEQDKRFAALVADVRAQMAAIHPAFTDREAFTVEGYVFISSPGAVTPYHIDPEWSFLAQVHGQKHYEVYDSAIMISAELEAFYRGDVMAAAYDASRADQALPVLLAPGDAMTHPRHAPHNDLVSAEYSVSFSFALMTKAWLNETPIYLANAALRKAGLRPDVVGRRPAIDLVKGVGYRAARRIGEVVRPVQRGPS